MEPKPAEGHDDRGYSGRETEYRHPGDTDEQELIDALTLYDQPKVMSHG